jgi:hypothetical protein
MRFLSTFLSFPKLISSPKASAFSILKNYLDKQLF